MQGTKIIALSATTATLFKKHVGSEHFDLFSKFSLYCLICGIVEKPIELGKL